MSDERRPTPWDLVIWCAIGAAAWTLLVLPFALALT